MLKNQYKLPWCYHLVSSFAHIYFTRTASHTQTGSSKAHVTIVLLFSTEETTRTLTKVRGGWEEILLCIDFSASQNMVV